MAERQAEKISRPSPLEMAPTQLEERTPEETTQRESRGDVTPLTNMLGPGSTFQARCSHMTTVIARICTSAANIICSAKERSDLELAPHRRAPEFCEIGSWEKSTRKNVI
jgi:hypothetical protein